MSDYWKKKMDELNQKSAKSTTKPTKKASTSSDYWGSRMNELNQSKKKKKKKDEDDIAPVRTTVTAPVKEKDEDKGFDFFQKGVFSDGYQFGDISKAILGTGVDVASGVVKGAAKLGEGIVDAGMYGVAAIADGYNEEHATKLRVTAQENVIDKKFEKWDKEWGKYSLLGETGDAISEGLGQVGTVILTGGLAGAAGFGAVGATAATTGVMGASSIGSGMSEAYQSGATDEEAATYGLVKGVVDAGSELLFGGLGKAVKAVGLSKGLSSLDDVLARKISDKVTNHVTKSLVQYGVKASGEGLEEVIAGVGSAMAKQATYMSDKELSELLEDENLLEQFVVGAVTSGVAQSGLVPGMQTGSLKESIETGRDFVSGLSQNEEKVIDKVWKDRIAEAEKDGKLTNKQKDKLYNEVVRDMERGYIDTDTIEEVLGGDTYKSYKDMVDSEDALAKEYEELGQKQNATLAEQTRYNELHEQMKVKDTTQRDQLKTKLGEEVMSLVQNDRLAESYNERSRRGQAFEVDVAQYNEKQRDTIQRAIDSGILNNTNRTHEFVDMIAKITADKGVSFDFTNNQRLKDSGFAVGGKTVNGFVTKDGVTLNIDSAKSLNSVVGHEITHVLEGTELYTELQSVLKTYAESKGEYQSRYDALAKLYDGVEGANVDAELTADLVGDYLFTDADFIHNLSTNNRNVFQKVYDEIKYLCKVATAGSKEARELEKVKRAFEQAYKAGNNGLSDTKYSVSDSDGKQLSKEQQDYFKDSKVRDENGNLKVMYHGTPNGDFTVFKDGTYFTDDKEYADRYQSPSASSISSGKVASAPKTFEVYLDIKKPFDITDAEARDIYINDYIKGGNAIGINPYLSDAEYDKITTIDWTEGEDLRDFLIENDYDYDGLVLDEGADGGYGDAVKSRGKSYVVFSPKQVKNIDNQMPTADPDIRFSLSESVEETKDLVALHNLQASELLKTLDLGGLPMPSIAVIKSGAAHEQYGDVSLILPKETIDPKINKDNKVYGGDAWTPTYPKIEYKPNEKVAKKIRDKYYGLANEIGYDAVRPMYSYVNELEDALNRAGGEGAMLEKLYEDTDMMNVYLQDSGKGKVEPIVKETVTEISEVEAEMNQFLIDAMGEDLVAAFKAPAGENPMKYRVAFMEQHETEILDAYKRYFMEEHAFTQEEADNALDNTTKRDLMKIMREAYMYTQNKGVTVKTETDYNATREAIRKAAADGYKEWVDSLFTGVQGKSGIRNNQDYYTRSGNPRSWDALHWENTLENVVKVMKSQEDTGTGSFSPFNDLFSKSHKQYGSIAEIKADADRLHKISDDDYEALKESFSNRFIEIANAIKDPAERNSFIALDQAAELIVDAVRTQKTKTGMLKYLQKWNSRATAQTVDDVISLMSDIANMPTGYFEAKPKRAVGLDEVGVFVIPNNADAKVKQELLNRGYSIAEYDPNVEGDRQRVVNGFEEYKFSLSSMGEQGKSYGNYNVSGKDIALAPTVSEMENVQEATVAKNATTDSNLFPDDLAPMSEPIPGQFDSLTDADAPPEMDAPYYEDEDSGEVGEVADPMEGRYIEDVGNQKVKAYMYENPEVKPFFQTEAAVMLNELENSTKGQKWYNDELYYESGGEHGWGGTKRDTSEDIAYLLDGSWSASGKGYTYDEIKKGLLAIIEDNGKENNACSKRIEFILNDRLREGYNDFVGGTGEFIPANEDYLKLLEEKQITEYNKEAFDALVEQGEQYAPPVENTVDAGDIAPVAAHKVEQDEYSITEPYEAIRPKREKEPRMARATPAEQARAEILTEEPEAPKKQSNVLGMIKNNLLDKGMVFEDLALATGNRELQARWNSVRYAEGKAQRLMEKGNAFTASLKSIREEVEQTGKTKEFYEYLYHLHNADRMTLEERYADTENKPVFGYGVTANESIETADALEQANPEFKKYAQDVYQYMTHLRELLVENGVISQETAQLWADMYPHYVPIRRAGDEGLNINVPLDTGRTGVNAPIKRAKGGNRDILPLFDTMAMRTEQTYKAIAKNRFGVELKNTLGTTIGNEAVSLDETIDSIDSQDSLLQEGKNGEKPTFTVFENGERVTFEITEEMYDAMKPKSKGLAYTNKTLNKLNNLRRGLLTEYNPAFMLTNPIKDTQDVLVNSQHPAKTYANYPKAIMELAGKKGHWYQEYMENGGEQNTYFDGETNTFVKEKSGLSKAIGFPLEKISEANNFIERIPRMAEYIASRKEGRSIDVSMLDAARVTTNFAAGGDLTKALNRNGFTFLNASVQGFMQNVRNFREAKANGLKGWATLAAKFAVAGLPSILLNHLMWEDDEEYEELSDYVKQNYYVVGKFGDGNFVRIPKGRTLAVIQNAFEQMENFVTGNDDVDLGTFADLVMTNLAPSNPAENNLIAPIMQVAKNETWYGDDMVPSRLQNLPAAEQFDESTDSISKWLGEKLNYSPVKINYLLDQYSGAVGDMFLPMLTPEAERVDNTLLAPVTDKFTTDSVMKNQNVSDFYTKKDELTVNANSRNATEEDALRAKYMNSINSELAELYGQKREIQNSDLSNEEKYAQVRNIQNQIVELTKEGLGNYEDISYESARDGEYANIGNRYFKRDDDGEWQKLSDEQTAKYKATSAAGDADYATDGENHYRWYVPEAGSDSEPGWRKITDKQLEKQEEVTTGLNISAADYWSNKEEYDYAYEYPEKYAVAKSVGGYEAYRGYSSELYDIKADKDENGKSISGSRKEKVLDYVNGLDADYGTKIILFKSEYNADDTYNWDIIDYLNGRDDISGEEMATILKELGFTVSDNGDISW